MNYLQVSFNWKNVRKSETSKKTELNDDILELHANRIPVSVFGNHATFSNHQTNIVSALIGYISNLDQICYKYYIDKNEDVEVIGRLYSLVGLKFISDLEGIFTILIWDRTHQKGYVFQDEFGSNLPLYYTYDNSTLYVSTSLKGILKKRDIRSELNISALRDFLIAKNIIPNKKTFIKGIYKLPPHKYISISGKKCSFRVSTLHYPKKKVSLKYAKDNLIKALKESIHVLHAQLKPNQRICALSAGFDSNAILYYLSGLADNILTITIGGQKKNEIAKAKMLADQYKNVKHISSVVSENKLEYFPDIVWKTEGYVCECGLFLQYELGSLLNKKGVTELICGEGADQILNQHRKRLSFNRLKTDFKTYVRYIIEQKIWPERFRESKLFKYVRRPTLRILYDNELDYILKKNGIILNSFGVQSIYPFIDRELLGISSALGELNHKKRYFIQELNPILGESKMTLLIKEGGATDVEYLFKGFDEIILKMLEHNFFKPLMSKKRILQIKNNMVCHHELIIRLLYIFIFRKLFISGEFDSKFDTEDFLLSLKNLLNDELV
jgi:asparagine synthetase B (glutamine-hydrolysing)